MFKTLSRKPSGTQRNASVALLALTVAGAAALAACKADETSTGGHPVGSTTHHGGGGEGGTAGGGGEGGGECSEGATRDCSVKLGEHDGVVSCFYGVETCTNGEWGLCEKSEEEPKAPAPQPAANGANTNGNAPPGTNRGRKRGIIQVKSLSSAANCVNNPCDPSCQTFDEVPPVPVISSTDIVIVPWDTGSYPDIPPNLQSQGAKEPCDSGSDCQFDQYCNNPTSGTCAHSKCVTGTGLAANCDPCVSNICVGSPGCCSTPLGSCAHDLCAIGTPLTSGCDPCVTSICSNPAFSFCCNAVTGGWTQECVNQVSTICSKSCATGSWTQSCADQVKSLCNAHCLKDEVAPICAHDKCYAGSALDSACDPCVAQVCLADPFCCTGGWDGICLQEVSTICGENCPTKGDCVPWLPKETDPTCFGYDLTVGVGCTSGGTPQIPICNHGSGNAPAGLPIAILPPAGTDHLGNCYVAIPGGTPIVNTPSVIAPGDCVNVALPAGLAEGSQIGVNLYNASGYNNAECHCSNNWSLWSGATGICKKPSCAGATAYAKLKKVKLFVTVDKSASQNCTIGSTGSSCTTTSPTRWEGLRSALTTFIQDPGSDDVGVWLRFWPYNVNGACPQAFPTGCGSLTGCRNANADVSDLASVANETVLLNALNLVTPTQNTPMFPALEGALLAATAFKAANPDTTPAVLMVTDGIPSLCSGVSSTQPLIDLTSLYFNGQNIRTYIIGIAEANSTSLSLIAGAGGGKSFFIANGTSIQAPMLAALDQIKQEFVTCELELPDNNIFDPTKATLKYAPGVGAPITVMPVADLAACAAADGWYYDNPADPTSVTLCPTTCTKVKTDTAGSLELSIDCVSQFVPSTYTQKYEGVCPPGKAPQWGFVAYETQTPGDSYVEFRARTSADDLSYSALQPMPIMVAKATPDTQVCGLGGPAPDCPIDLYEPNALNGPPNVRNKYLELVMNVYPTTDGSQSPSILNWEVTYSCPDAE